MTSWLVNISEIQAGKSAVLGGNYFIFYALHCTAITILLISLTSCFILITYILIFTRKERWDFPDRFPLYQAVADVIWSLCNISEHLLLITTKVYPEMSSLPWENVSLWVFVGYVYQEVMHMGLTAYAYFSIVKNRSPDLGKGDWKLHCCCVVSISLVIGGFWPLGAFGPSGYWLLSDVNSPSGFGFSLYIASVTTIHAMGTTWGYVSIHNKVEAQKKKMAQQRGHNSQRGSYRIATDCLNTFVCLSVCLYCPLAVAIWIFVTVVSLGYVEPLVPLVIILITNSTGWANSVGYLRNRRLKNKNPQNVNMDESSSFKMENLSWTS